MINSAVHEIINEFRNEKNHVMKRTVSRKSKVTLDLGKIAHLRYCGTRKGTFAQTTRSGAKRPIMFNCHYYIAACLGSVNSLIVS